MLQIVYVCDNWRAWAEVIMLACAGAYWLPAGGGVPCAIGIIISLASSVEFPMAGALARLNQRRFLVCWVYILRPCLIIAFCFNRHPLPRRAALRAAAFLACARLYHRLDKFGWEGGEMRG